MSLKIYHFFPRYKRLFGRAGKLSIKAQIANPRSVPTPGATDKKSLIATSLGRHSAPTQMEGSVVTQ